MKKFLQPQYERLQKINERLNQGGKPVSKADLLRLCDCSEKTLKNDLAYLRDAHNAKIYFERDKKCHKKMNKSEQFCSI